VWIVGVLWASRCLLDEAESGVAGENELDPCRYGERIVRWDRENVVDGGWIVGVVGEKWLAVEG
jgi:hypothetical protein